MSIGERITEQRKASGLSQGQLAHMLGVTRQAVSKWENDLSSPDTLKLIKLADILSVDVEFLATGRAVPKENEPEKELPISPKPTVQIIERIIDRPVVNTIVKKRVRIKYRRDPLEYCIVAIVSMIAGVIVGALLF